MSFARGHLFNPPVRISHTSPWSATTGQHVRPPRHSNLTIQLRPGYKSHSDSGLARSGSPAQNYAARPSAYRLGPSILVRWALNGWCETLSARRNSFGPPNRDPPGLQSLMRNTYARTEQLWTTQSRPAGPSTAGANLSQSADTALARTSPGAFRFRSDSDTA